MKFAAIDSVKDCKKDLKVKAKGPLTEFLRTVKTTLAELEKTPGMSTSAHGRDRVVS